MKRQHYKCVVLIVLALLVSIQLSACENSEPAATIVGHWRGEFRFEYYNVVGMRYTESGDEFYIYEDGTFRIDGENGESDGRYELLYDGQAITFNFRDCGYGPFDISLESRNTLIIETNADTFYLERIS